jgi:uncharacterized delta-60 repeat protein
MRAPASTSCQPLEPRRLLRGAAIDTSFGDGGVATLDVGPQTVVVTSLAQPDGKLLVAGRQGSNAFLARFTADGAVDTSFGGAGAGYTKFDLGANERFDRLAVTADGRILAAGNTSVGARSRGFVARYTDHGTLDAAFGSGDGIVMLPVGQPLGDFAVSPTKFFTLTESTLRRHNLGSGSLDVGFDTDGQVSLLVPGGLNMVLPHDLAVSADGTKLAIDGFADSDDPTEKQLPQRFAEDQPRGNAVIVRDAATGAPVTAFDDNGVAFYEGADVPVVTFAPSGDILVADNWSDFDFRAGPGLFRFQPDGDYAFTPAPAAEIQPATVRALPDGRVMAGGWGIFSRYKADGSLDLTYSNDGTAQGNLPQYFAAYPQLTAAGSPTGQSLAILDDGGVLLAQYAERPSSQTSRPTSGPILLRKLLPDQPNDPSVDVTLGSDGTLSITTTAGDDQASASFESDVARVNVRVNDEIFRFPIADVKAVAADLGDGNDNFSSLGGVNARVDGGAGNDRIVTGNGADTLIGGLGNDELFGGAGDDSLYGNGGKDTLHGEDGRDRLDGGRSNDVLHGGAQPDRLIGGEGIDQIYGEGGNDTFYAVDGTPDSLYGGSGTDRAFFDEGADVLFSIENPA